MVKKTKDMGATFSYFGNNSTGRTDDPDPITGLTSRDKYLITTTWSCVHKDLVKFGVELLFLFLTYHPHYQNYFPFKDIPLEELHQNKVFRAHSTNVIYSLSSVVDNITNNNLVVQLLTKTGESHARRAIPGRAFYDLKPVFVEVLQKTLGPKLTKEGVEAWNKTLEVAFKVITEKLDN